MKIFDKFFNREKFIQREALNKTDAFLREQMLLPITETQSQDIFIAGYPKSGNTWMQNLVSGIQFGIDTALLPDKLTQELVPDVHGKKYYKRFGRVTFFKTHDLPQRHMRKVIHLVRDGRDAMASYYAMNLAMGKDSTLKEMIIEGKDIYPSKWFVHTREWLNNPFKAEVLIVKYEDLINQPLKQLKRISEFSNLNRSEDIIKRTINGNSFEEMQKKEINFGWNNENWDPSKKFIRQGKIGSYKREIPEDLIKLFENEAKLELEYFKYLSVNS